MKTKKKAVPTSTTTDFKHYYYACRYPYDAPQLATNRYSLKDSTMADFHGDIVLISQIPGFILDTFFECTVTQDEDHIILIECPSLQIYSTGETREEAISNMQENIVCLIEDLSQSDDFSDDWLQVKEKLLGHISRG